MISRPFEPESDMSEILALLLACRNAETIDCFLPFHLRLILTPRSFLTTDTLNLSTDVRVWEGEDGKVAGFALVDISVWGLYYLVDPSEEGGQLEQDILSWAIHRTTEIVQGTNYRLTCAKVRADNEKRISSLEQAGFCRVDAYKLRMARDLDEPIDKPQVPRGFAIRHLSGDAEVPAYVDLVGDIFSNATSIDGKPAGRAGWFIVDGIVRFRSIGTNTWARGRGVGSILVQYVQNHPVVKEQDALVVFSLPQERSGAEKFYEKLGFRTCGFRWVFKKGNG